MKKIVVEYIYDKDGSHQQNPICISYESKEKLHKAFSKAVKKYIRNKKKDRTTSNLLQVHDFEFKAEDMMDNGKVCIPDIYYLDEWFDHYEKRECLEINLTTLEAKIVRR